MILLYINNQYQVWEGIKDVACGLLSSLICKRQIFMMNLEVTLIFYHYCWCDCQYLSISKAGNIITKEYTHYIGIFNMRVIHEGIGEVIWGIWWKDGTLYFTNRPLYLWYLLQGADQISSRWCSSCSFLLFIISYMRHKFSGTVALKWIT